MLTEWTKDVAFLGGTFYSETGDSADGYVLVCGGFVCIDEGVPGVPGCVDRNSCYSWHGDRPSGSQWVEEAPLNNKRVGHLMTTAPNISATSNQEYPLVIGLDDTSELFDTASNTWMQYRSLELAAADLTNPWLTPFCLVRYRYKIYRIGTEVQELDTLYWEIVNLGPVPEFLTGQPSRCAMAEIDGEIGETIFL